MKIDSTSGEDLGLPELPEDPAGVVDVDCGLDEESGGRVVRIDDGYSADQMRAYAAESVKLERERCAKLCESTASGYDPTWAADMQRLAIALAAAIRASR